MPYTNYTVGPKSVLTLYYVSNVLFLTSVVRHISVQGKWLVLSCPLFEGFTGLEGNIGYWGGWSPPSPPPPPPAPTPLMMATMMLVFMNNPQVLLVIIITCIYDSHTGLKFKSLMHSFCIIWECSSAVDGYCEEWMEFYWN